MLWILIGFTLGIFILLYFLLYMLGTEKKLISFVKSNEIEFRMIGGTLDKILENVPGYMLKKDIVLFKTLSSKNEVISSQYIEAERFFPLAKGEKKRKHFFGIYWIGLFYPYNSILKWNFSWPKLVTKGQEEKEKAKKRIVVSSVTGSQLISYASEKITSLYHVYTYPIEVPDIELVGLITTSIEFNLKIEVVIPIIPVIILKGNWFEPFTALIKGIISERLRRETIKSLEAMDKAQIFSALIQENNDRLIAVTGMRVSDVAYVGYQIAGSPEVRKAATAGEVARLQGEGTIETAKVNAIAEIKKAIAKAKATRLDGAAKARALKNLLDEAGKRPNGIEILREQIRTEAVVGFTGNVLSQGTTVPLQLAVDTDKAGKNKKKSDKNSSKKGGDNEQS